MRKIILSFVCLLLVSVIAYADQTLNGRQTREWENANQNQILHSTDYQADTTAFTNVVATGHQATGNAGYIALVGTDFVGVNHTYYLWVDGSTSTGTLMMSSFPNIKTYSSFPYGDWRASDIFGVKGGFQAGSKVSGQ